MTIAKIGQHNPAAVIRDVHEKIDTLRTLVVVGIHTDSSCSVWQSETPVELERAAIILTRFALDAQGYPTCGCGQ
jgi:hypothetical protein